MVLSAESPGLSIGPPLRRGLAGWGGPRPAAPHPGFSPQAGAHAAVHALQAPLRPRVRRLLRLFRPDRLRGDRSIVPWELNKYYWEKKCFCDH